MKIRNRYIGALLLIALIAITSATSYAGAKKEVLTMDDYALWRSPTSTVLSNDGDWITYDYRKPNAAEDAADERNLQIKHLDSKKVYEVPFGTSPKFSDDSKWVAYILDVDAKEAKKLKEKKEPVIKKAVLLNLETGDELSWDNVSSVSFSKCSSVLAINKPKAEGVKHAGHDLIVHDIAKKLDTHLGSVSSISFNESGTLLAYTRDAADKTGNGLYIMNTETGVQTPLEQDAATYSKMTWNKEGTALAVLKGNSKEGFTQRENELLAFSGLGTDVTTQHALDPSTYKKFPQDMVITESGKLSWNEDSTKVFFDIKDQVADKKKDKKKAEKVSDVDIWHWKDVRIQSVQRARAKREKNKKYRSVYHLESSKFVRLTDEAMKRIDITPEGKWGVGTDDRTYIHDWKVLGTDYYRVNTETGKRTLMLTALKSELGLSPDSKYFAYWLDEHIWVYEFETAKHTNLTKNAPVSFVNQEWDYPLDADPYGIGGWAKDGSAVILNHRYDLWLQPLDGTAATNLTSGVGDANDMQLRYFPLDMELKTSKFIAPGLETNIPFIDLSKKFLLRAYGQWTKKAGFYTLDASDATNKPEELMYKDAKIRGLKKASYADRYMMGMQTFSESPDYYVTDGDFDKLRKITDSNPHQEQFKWGHSVLIDYTNKDGVRLQGALYIPDDRKRNERMPMLVSFYEKSSQMLHDYLAPGYASSSWSPIMEMVSKGYMYLLPDIHFNTGRTGDDMLESVEAAVDKAIELGYADPDRIGLCGHSFSGYGANFIAVKSTKFAAVSAGAGVVNHISDFNHLWGYNPELKKGSGDNAPYYDILDQGRMGTDPYENFELYRDQSPVMFVKDMTTPLLLLHGESDPTVAWIEAVEMYNAMRFNEKEVIFLSYPDEGHGLGKRENKKDFTNRVMDFFDYHVMGEPAADWIKNGVPYIEKPSQK